jgi:hypothetical protein
MYLGGGLRKKQQNTADIAGSWARFKPDSFPVQVQMFTVTQFWCVLPLAFLKWLAVVQLIEALGYKPEGRGFDSRWCDWYFSLTYSF